MIFHLSGRWPHPQRKPRGKFVILLAAALILALLLLEIFLNPYKIHYDCAMHLEAGRMMLQGKVLYLDFYDANPPLICYLNIIPALIAQFFSLKAPLAFSLFVFLLVVATTLMTYACLKPIAHQSFYHEREVLCLFLALGSFLVWRWNLFGQREHLFLLLYFPFFVLRWQRWGGHNVPLRRSLIWGLCGAIGLLLKPHFLLIGALLEVYWLISRKKFRVLLAPEMISVLGIGLLYAAHFALLPHQALTNWLGRFVPQYLLYWPRSPWAQMLGLRLTVFSISMNLTVFVLALSLGGIFLAFRIKSDFNSLLRALSVFSLLAFLVYLIPRQAWFYHALPAFWAALMVLGMILARGGLFSAWGNARPTGFYWRIPSTLWAILVVLAFGLAAAVQLRGGTRPLDNDPLTRAILQFSHKGESLIFISHSPSAQFPRTLQTERKLGSRYVYHYPLFSIQNLRKKDREKARREEQLYLDELRSDIVQNRPRLIFINQDDWPLHFTDRIADALGNYRLLKELDGKFAVYRRMGI